MAAGNDTENVDRQRFLGSAAAAAGSGLVVIGPAMPAEPAKPSVSFNSPTGNKIPFSREELFAGGATRVFEGRYLNEIAFPLGRIGTGTVSLGGGGQLRDWEIFNRPNKGGKLPFSFAAASGRVSGWRRGECSHWHCLAARLLTRNGLARRMRRWTEDRRMSLSPKSSAADRPLPGGRSLGAWHPRSCRSVRGIGVGHCGDFSYTDRKR